MSITIDRNQNIIISQGGEAHRTGYVAIGYHAAGSDCDVIIARGVGYYEKGAHHTDASKAIWRGKRDQLTADLFQQVTGWKQ